MKKILTVILFLVLIAAGWHVPTTSAKEEIQSVSDHITVWPAKFEIWGNPGETMTQTLRITNEDNVPVILALSVEPFTTDEDGKIVLSPNQPINVKNDLQKWIMFKTKGTQFQPKETKLINFSIDVPKNALPGGKYASIVVRMDHVDKTENEVTATAKVVSLVMLSITGDIIDEARVKSFKATDKRNKTLDFDFKIQNAGNNHIRPKGSIVVTNLWGVKVDEIKLEDENILPNVTKNLSSQWDPEKFLFGRYTASLVATYGFSKPLTMTATTNFWVGEWYWSLIFSLLLLGLLYVIVRFGRKGVLMLARGIKRK